jgi:hypothetical protein
MPTTQKLNILFPIHPKIDTTDIARRRTWLSKCGRYQIVHCRYLLSGMPDAWFAMVDRSKGDQDQGKANANGSGGSGVGVSGRPDWHILGRHRKRGPAAKDIIRHAKEMDKKESHKGARPT